MALLRVKNWAEFQHYKDRDPPWIKLHRGLLDNRDFHRLSPLAGKLLPLVWLIASERGGALLEIDELAFRLRISEEQCEAVLNDLQEKSFIVSDEVSDDAAQPSVGKQRAEMNGFSSRHIPDKVKRAVWERDGGKCVQCGSEENIEYDHKNPVSKGGASDEGNVQLLCRSCNRKKRTSTPAEQGATSAQPQSDAAYPETEAQDQLSQRKSCVVSAPEVLTPLNPAVEIIQIFDAERNAVFGEELRRIVPNSTDLVHAKRWLASGATTELCRGVFRDGFNRKRGQGPPNLLKYFDQAIANAIAEQNRPPTQGTPDGRSQRVGPATGIAAGFAEALQARSGE